MAIAGRAFPSHSGFVRPVYSFQPGNRALADNAAASDGLVRTSLVLARSNADNAAASDGLVRSSQSFSRSLSDGAAASDAAQRWRHLQAQEVDINAAGSTFNFTVSKALTTGSKQIYWATHDGILPATTLNSISDGTHSFTKMYTFDFSISGRTDVLEVWVLDTVSGQNGTTPTYTLTFSSSGVGAVGEFQEIAGLAAGTTTAACWDGTPGTYNGGGGITTSPVTVPSYASSIVGEYVTNVLADPNVGESTWVSPYPNADMTASANAGTYGAINVAYRNSVGGTEGGAWTWTPVGTDYVGVLIVAWKLALSGSSSHSASLSDNAAASDALTRAMAESRAAADNAAASDGLVRSTMALARTVADNAAASDALTRLMIEARSNADSASALDGLVRGAPFVVQHNAAVYAGSPVTIVMGSNVTADNLIVVATSRDGSGTDTGPTSVTDSQGNSYTNATGDVHQLNIGWASIWYAIAKSTGPNTITISTPSNGFSCQGVAYEIGGCATSGSLDIVPSSATGGSGAAVGNTMAGLSSPVDFVCYWALYSPASGTGPGGIWTSDFSSTIAGSDFSNFVWAIAGPTITGPTFAGGANESSGWLAVGASFKPQVFPRLSLPRSVGDNAAASDVLTHGQQRSNADNAAASDVLTRALIEARTNADNASASDVLTRALVEARSLGDNAAGSDALARTLVEARTAADNAAASDVLTRALQLARSLADNAAGADVLTRALVEARALADNAAGGDALVRALAQARSTNDQAAASDQLAQGARNRSINDNAAASDVLTRAVVEARTTADNAAASDVLTRLMVDARALADNAAGSDGLVRSVQAFTRTLADNAAGTDVLTRTLHLARILADNAAGSDVLARAVALARTLNDNAAGTDVVTRALVQSRSTNDQAAASDQLVQGARVRTINDNAAAADVLTRLVVEARALADNAAGSDVLTRLVADARTAADNAAASDALARSGEPLARSLADNAAGADVLTRLVVEARTLADNAAASDASTHTGGGGGGGLNDGGGAADNLLRTIVEARALADNAGGADVLTRLVADHRTAADNAAASDGLVRSAVLLARTVGDNAAAADSLAPGGGRHIFDGAAGADVLVHVVAFQRSLVDLAAASDSIRANPVHPGYIRVWLSGSWQLKPVKVWTGSAWVIKPLKYWNGTAWDVSR